MASYPIKLGQLFLSWGEFKEAIQDWSIADKFQFRSLHKDRSRADYRCRTRAKKGDCPWRVYATTTSNQDIRVKILEPRHTCGLAARTKRETCNSQSWLRRHVPKYLNVTRQTRPEEIQQTIKVHYGEIVNYQAAHEAKTALANNPFDHRRIVSHQLPAYLHPPHVDTYLQRNHPTKLWLKSTSAASLGRDACQATTTTSDLHHYPQLDSRSSLSPKIEPQDVERKPQLHLPNPTRETRTYNRIPLRTTIRLPPLHQVTDPRAAPRKQRQHRYTCTR